MIEGFSDMPEDTFGGRIAGTLTCDDYVITFPSILWKIRDSGRPLRVLVVLEPDFVEQPVRSGRGSYVAKLCARTN